MRVRPRLKLLNSLGVAKEVFITYLKAELIRGKGAILGAISLMIWLVLFIAPVMLFKGVGTSVSEISAKAFVALMIFLSYTVATWDWAWELRWLNYQGILEYILASGRSILTHYLGLIPLSIIWFVGVTSLAYAMLSLLVAPPTLVIKSVTYLLLGFTQLLIILFSYSLILGSVTISTGSAGPMLEFLGWILPIATGGIIPLASLPKVIQLIALATPFSYPAELIRYSLSISSTVYNVYTEAIVGSAYSVTFLLISLLIFKTQIKKILREGIKSVALH